MSLARAACKVDHTWLIYSSLWYNLHCITCKRHIHQLCKRQSECKIWINCFQLSGRCKFYQKSIWLCSLRPQENRKTLAMSSRRSCSVFIFFSFSLRFLLRVAPFPTLSCRLIWNPTSRTLEFSHKIQKTSQRISSGSAVQLTRLKTVGSRVISVDNRFFLFY